MLDGCSITRQWSPFKADGVQLVNLGNIAAYVVARIFLAQPLGHASGEPAHTLFPAGDPASRANGASNQASILAQRRFLRDRVLEETDNELPNA
jgi:hypothetical protein